MDWNMEMECKIMETVIFMRDNLWMDYHKAMENIFGGMVVHLKVTLSKVTETAMEYGRIITMIKFIKDIIC